MNITLQRIIDELKMQKKTQKQLTDFLNLSGNTFTNWKSGLNKSYEKYIYAISEFLGVSVEYLHGEKAERTEINKDITDDDIKFALWGGDTEIVDDEMYETIKGIAKTLAEQKRKKNEG